MISLNVSKQIILQINLNFTRAKFGLYTRKRKLIYLRSEI